MPLDQCLEEIWGPDSPRSAVQSLHTRVLHIRQAFARVPPVGSQRRAKELLATQHRGYRLNVDPESLDLHACDAYVSRAQKAQAARDDRQLRSALRSALALWRGPVLSDVSTGTYLQSHIVGLEEYRLNLLERCLEAELRLGLHHELLPQLGQLVAEHPTNENFHAQYMIALHRSGRSAQALDIHRSLHDSLSRELGIAPSPKLGELQTAILNADHILDAPPADRHGLSLDLCTADTGKGDGLS
ncbi:BTAD domain-containing putative transcriptional regulator [Streptomyces sp. NPDC017529]|uniref:AfsR/SARP family transcriptional regulator n=1 Tax=Streptomyces sp. NPDC017529 TaxID=3365000 RepID=UPI0037B0F4D6